MSFYELIANSIVDEKDATDEYDEMMQSCKDDESLTDSEKALILSTIASIKRDEETHQMFLGVIKAILDDKREEKKSEAE